MAVITAHSHFVTLVGMQANRDAEEAARSQTVLADTRDRTGMLDTSAQSAALNRQIGAAAGNEGKAEAVSAEKPAAAPAEDESGARQKCTHVRNESWMSWTY